jgi:hypothetical protein
MRRIVVATGLAAAALLAGPGMSALTIASADQAARGRRPMAVSRRPVIVLVPPYQIMPSVKVPGWESTDLSWHRNLVLRLQRCTDGLATSLPRLTRPAGHLRPLSLRREALELAFVGNPTDVGSPITFSRRPAP